MKIKLFVSHRIDQQNIVLKNDILTPVYCGAVYKQDKWQPELIGDCTGDNISEKRMSYCELTVQYWAWKNVDADYYGLCHYRRYLSFNDVNGIKNEQNHIIFPFMTQENIKKYNINNIEAIKKYCSNYDAVFLSPVSVKQLTAMGANAKNVIELWRAHEKVFFDEYAIDELVDSIKKIRPDIYSDAINYLYSDLHRGYNCFLMKNDIFKEMCEFEFDVLHDFSSKNINKHYPRTIAYMGEILFGIYQYHITKEPTKPKIKFTNLIFYESTRIKIKSITCFFCKMILEKIINARTRRNIKQILKTWRKSK